MHYQSAAHHLCPLPRCLLVPLLVFFHAVVAPMAMAQVAAGGVRGKIIDSDFSIGVAGVMVGLQGTDRAVRADANGNYFFNDLPPGNYSVTASREGYKLLRPRPVAVISGSVREADLEMVGEVVELEDYVIESDDLLGAESVGLLDVRASLVSFTDSIGADFISKAGGSDAGDLVKRIVGTSVADSRYVVVRGLSDRYNTVLLNGARIPSSDPDKRAVNIDIFPSSLIASLSNTKTFTAEIPGESTGGSINIVTKSSPDKPYAFSFSTGIGYNTQATGNDQFLKERSPGTGLLGTQNDRGLPEGLKNLTAEDIPSPINLQKLDNYLLAGSLLPRDPGRFNQAPPEDFSFNLSAGTQIKDFFGAPLGLLAAVTYSKKYGFEPDLVQDTLVIQNRRLVNTQVFRTAESSEQILAGLLVAAGWEPSPTDRIKLTLFANIAADLTTFSQQGLIEGGTDSPSQNTLETAERIAVRGGETYVERRLRTLQFTGSHSLNLKSEAMLNWTATYSLSSQYEPDGRFFASVFNRETGEGERLPEFRGPNNQRYWRYLDDTNYNILADIKFPFGAITSEQYVGEIKFGGNFERSDRDYRADTFGNDGFVTRALPAETYEASQDIAAGYAAVEIRFAEKLRATVGLRAEVTDIRVFRDRKTLLDSGGGLDTRIAPITDPFNEAQILPPDKIGRADIEEVNVLPALNITWDFYDNMKLRFAASRTVARPSFKELAPVFIQEPQTGDVFRGNSLLETSNIDNLDVRMEWFPVPGNVVALSFFTKFIDRPIELFTSPSNDFFANQKSAVIYGYEFEFQQNLGFMAEELRPFAIGFNGALLYSQVQLNEQAVAPRLEAGLEETRRLQGQPDSLLNFNITYDNKETGLFAGLFLNITGETLYQAGTSAGTVGFKADVYQEPVTSLDFTISQKVGENWKAVFRAENLVNDDVERFAEGQRVYSKSSGTKYSFSLGGTW